MAGYLDTGSPVWINLLNSGQTNIAQHFSKKRIGESDLIGRSGKKVSLPGSIGQFEGEVISKVILSESIFFFNKVLNIELINMDFDPLTYYYRRFNGLTII
jgi:flavin reductase (DIM6/NTAB) family NADH-FMN oxidoreductase RutF